MTTETAIGVVLDHLLADAVARATHTPLVGKIEDRLDAARHVAGEQRDRTRRRDGGQTAIANAVLRDRTAHVLGQACDVGRRDERGRIIKWESALFRGNLRTRRVSERRDLRHEPFSQGTRFRGVVAQPAHGERIAKARNAEADPTLGLGLVALRLERVVREIDHVVEEAHRDWHELGKARLVDVRDGREGIADEGCKIDRSEQARAVGRERLLTARIGGADLLAVGEVVHGIDAIDEDHAGLGIVVGRAHDALPERARPHSPIDRAFERQRPGVVALDGGHEGVRDQHREIEVSEARRIGLGVDEGLDVGMVTAHGGHHGAAPLAGRHDGLAHGIPHIHEADRPRGPRADALHERAGRPQRREIMADAAPLLHGEGGFLHILEDRAEVVGDRPHDEAVEERDVAARAGTGNDAARREELKIRERIEKTLLPALAPPRLLDAGTGRGEARPGLLDACLERRAVSRLQAIFRIPDEPGNGRDFWSFARHAAGALPSGDRSYI